MGFRKYEIHLGVLSKISLNLIMKKKTPMLTFYKFLNTKRFPSAISLHCCILSILTAN